MEEIGPVDYAIIVFPGNKFRGEIAPAIGDLVDAIESVVVVAVPCSYPECHSRSFRQT